MPEKKTTKPSTNFEKKLDNAKKVTVETAEKVGAESKKVAGKISNRWTKSSTEDKICTCLGIVLIICGLLFHSIRALILPLILIILGVLLITGFFNNTKK